MPSGVWAPEEYAKLPTYDGEIGDQVQAGAFGAFHCHSSAEQLCAGWAGHRDPRDLLAIRIGISGGHVGPAAVDYTTDVPLWESGAEAAAHGLRDVDTPGPKATAAIDKLIRVDPTRIRRD